MNDMKKSNEYDEVQMFVNVTKVPCDRMKEEGEFENEF